MSRFFLLTQKNKLKEKKRKKREKKKREKRKMKEKEKGKRKAGVFFRDSEKTLRPFWLFRQVVCFI